MFPWFPLSQIISASKPCQINYFYFICGYNYINKYSSEKKNALLLIGRHSRIQSVLGQVLSWWKQPCSHPVRSPRAFERRYRSGGSCCVWRVIQDLWLEMRSVFQSTAVRLRGFLWKNAALTLNKARCEEDNFVAGEPISMASLCYRMQLMYRLCWGFLVFFSVWPSMRRRKNDLC